MKAHTRVLTLTFLLLSILKSVVVLASDLGNIDTLCKSIDKIINENKTQQILFFLGSASAEKQNKWTRVNDAYSKELFNKSLIKAEVFSHNKKIIKGLITTQSESGDWKIASEYFFYGNDKTALIFEKNVTFQGYDYDKDKPLPPGPYSLEKKTYFNKDGEKIKTILKGYILSNKKEIDPKYIHQIQLEEYMNVKMLPIYELIEGKPGTVHK